MKLRRRWVRVRSAVMVVLTALGLAAVPRPGLAQAVHLSRQTLQAQVEKAFPKTQRGVTLSEPELQLEGAREVAVLWVDGTMVYTAPSFVGWAVKDLRVQQDRLRIEF